MEKSVVNGYIEKLNHLVESCLCANRIFDHDIKPKNQDDPNLGIFWKNGAFSGAFVYFLLAQTEEEKAISELVFGETMGDISAEAPIQVMDYINAALELLNSLGYSVPRVEDVKSDPGEA